MLRWFHCWIPGINSEDDPAKYKATSASKARYCCYLSARDAGYRVTFADIHVRRAR
jgi:hypothetical protein